MRNHIFAMLGSRVSITSRVSYLARTDMQLNAQWNELTTVEHRRIPGSGIFSKWPLSNQTNGRRDDTLAAPVAA